MHNMSARARIEAVKCFGGSCERWTHESVCCKSKMHFSLFIPPKLAEDKPLSVLYVISGLTCNDRNFTDKVKPAQEAAAR